MLTDDTPCLDGSHRMPPCCDIPARPCLLCIHCEIPKVRGSVFLPLNFHFVLFEMARSYCMFLTFINQEITKFLYCIPFKKRISSCDFFICPCKCFSVCRSCNNLQMSDVTGFESMSASVWRVQDQATHFSTHTHKHIL